MRGDARYRRKGRGAAARRLTTVAAALAAALFMLLPVVVTAAAQGTGDRAFPIRLQQGRFTVMAFRHDELLARSLLTAAAARDSFPGLPRPAAAVEILIAPDRAGFRDLIGAAVPEWGAAVAFPALQRVVMQGSRADSRAGDPIQVLRHELAHLALHEHLGNLPPRWFDEGYASYAAGEWNRDHVLATNVSLALRGMPTLAQLDSQFRRGAGDATYAYALAYRAVAELAAIDRERGLSLFFRYWRESGSLDRAIRRAYGLTLDGFDDRWRSRTRQRYGALALFANLSLAGGVIVLLVAPLYVLRRRRDRRRLDAMVAREEEVERQERLGAIEELLRSVKDPG